MKKEKEKKNRKKNKEKAKACQGREDCMRVQQSTTNQRPNNKETTMLARTTACIDHGLMAHRPPARARES